MIGAAGQQKGCSRSHSPNAVVPTMRQQEPKRQAIKSRHSTLTIYSNGGKKQLNQDQSTQFRSQRELRGERTKSHAGKRAIQFAEDLLGFCGKGLERNPTGSGQQSNNTAGREIRGLKVKMEMKIAKEEVGGWRFGGLEVWRFGGLEDLEVGLGNEQCRRKKQERTQQGCAG
ncbi:hypothetical protein PABG_11836 [Paracoccidioides brasiliensis Pb03]|nr:hypothetical protein PABG_11836 [Paracoccidioides brasiliensis Pb03]